MGVREGMFGVSGSGDTSGYGGLVKPTMFPGAQPAPLRRLVRRGGRCPRGASGPDRPVGAIEKVVIDRGEITFHVRAQ